MVTRPRLRMALTTTPAGGGGTEMAGTAKIERVEGKGVWASISSSSSAAITLHRRRTSSGRAQQATGTTLDTAAAVPTREGRCRTRAAVPSGRGSSVQVHCSAATSEKTTTVTW